MHNLDPVVEMYLTGMSTNQIAEKTGVAASTVWRRVKASGHVRDASESVRLAISQGRGAAKLSGRPREISDEWRQKMTEASNATRRAKAKGSRVNSKGYVEYTLGPNAGRSAHVVRMEERIGRKLLQDEVVHHIDGDKQNNSDSNLSLMTLAGHSRLHRFQDALSGAKRARDANGKFLKGDIS